MANYILTPSKKETDEFYVNGVMNVCAVGKGQIAIMRDIGSGFWPITADNDNSDSMVFVNEPGEDLIFNGHIKCTPRMKCKIVGDTTEEIKVTVLSE